MMNSLFHKNKRRIVNMGIAVYKVTMGNNCTVGLIQIMAANRLRTCANKMTMTYKNIKKKHIGDASTNVGLTTTAHFSPKIWRRMRGGPP